MTEKRRKLIFFWNYLEWGGAQIYFIAIMKVAKADWDIQVVLPRGSSEEILRYLDRIDVNYDFIENHLDLSPAPTIGQKLKRQFRRVSTEIESLKYLSQFDLKECILHIEAAPWQSWIFLTLLRLRRAKVFMTLHNALPATNPAWRELVWKLRMQFVSRLAGMHVFASNKDTKNKFRGYFGEKFWKTIKVTYTCVNPPEIESALASANDPAKIRDRFGIGEDRFVVLCVAQFIDRKGRWTFLDAAKIVAATDPNVVFVWLTPKLPDDKDMQRIEGYGLGDTFKLILSADAGKTRDEIFRFFLSADIFAAPSIVDGLPIAILEAMALGLPTVSTSVYAIPEAVKDRETGLLVEPQDPRALADAIIELKGDAYLRQRLSKAGRAFVLENFDERVASQIAIAEYEESFSSGK